jgi:hypothetical protein
MPDLFTGRKEIFCGLVALWLCQVLPCSLTRMYTLLCSATKSSTLNELEKVGDFLGQPDIIIPLCSRLGSWCIAELRLAAGYRVLW